MNRVAQDVHRLIRWVSLAVGGLSIIGILMDAHASVPKTPPHSPLTAKLAPVTRPDGLALFDENGNRVLTCEKADEKFVRCHLEPGVSLDDETNAWVNAYVER